MKILIVLLFLRNVSYAKSRVNELIDKVDSMQKTLNYIYQILDSEQKHKILNKQKEQVMEACFAPCRVLTEKITTLDKEFATSIDNDEGTNVYRLKRDSLIQERTVCLDKCSTLPESD